MVIVGSGLGGLVCGYMLSKNGYDVTVLEKNAQIGGCLQTFRRGGVKFDTGMHYIGSMLKNQILRRFFDYFGLTRTVPLQQLDTGGYDVISLAGETFRFANGYDQFVDTLAQQFPNNVSDIRNYISRVREIADASPLYNLRKINNNIFIEADYIKTSINEFIASSTSNPKLQNVLAGNLPLYAGVKDKTPTYVHALIHNFYIQSAFRIIGGSDTIAQSLAKSIENFGGRVRTNAEVDKVLCDDTHATAVRLTSGEVVEGDYFVSNVHPQAFLGKIDSHIIRKAYRERISRLENTISNFTVYIKFKENATPYLNCNYYLYEQPDVWKSNNYDIGKWPQSYLYMHQCHQKNPVYAQSAELIGYMRYDEVRRWEDTRVGQRGQEYLDFKQQKAERLLSSLEQSFPGIRGCIESYYTSSPLTYQDYTATHEGSMYGIIRDKNFPSQTYISQRTKIPNLYMTGQNINSHGILGVTIGGVITCAEFLGINKIIQEIYDNE